LAALICLVADRQGLKTLLVTSAERGDGRTVTAANLAAAASLAGRRVALVSADFGDPGLQRMLGVNGSQSLGDVLTGTVETRDALQEADGVLVLTSKPGPKTPQGLLLKPGGISRVLADLRSSADLVVIDAPPVETADTIAMAP